MAVMVYIYEVSCVRSIYKGHGEMTTLHSICWMELLVPVFDTSFMIYSEGKIKQLRKCGKCKAERGVVCSQEVASFWYMPWTP